MGPADKFQAARIATLCIVKNFLRLQIKKTQPHRPVAQKSFQVTASAATTEIFLRIKRYHRVAAFPSARAPRITTEANSVPKCPHAAEFAHHSARRRDTGRCGVSVIANAYRNLCAVRLERTL